MEEGMILLGYVPKEEEPFLMNYQLIDGELVFNSRRALEDRKNSLLVNFESLAQKELDYGFYLTLYGGKKLRFRYTTEDQLLIQNMKELFNQGLIESARLTFFNMEGEEERRDIDKTSIYEIDLLGFLHKEKVTAKLKDEMTERTRSARTIEELDKIKWTESVE